MPTIWSRHKPGDTVQLTLERPGQTSPVILTARFQNRQPGLMLLISLAITVSFVYSLFALLAVPCSGFFWEMATLLDITLLAHSLVIRRVRPAAGPPAHLANLMPAPPTDRSLVGVRLRDVSLVEGSGEAGIGHQRR